MQESKAQAEVKQGFKKQVASICHDLRLHSSVVNNLLLENSHVHSPVILGHFEAHMEKVNDSIAEIKFDYEIAPLSPSGLSGANLQPESKDLTDTQGLKLLRRRIQNLGTKVRGLLDAKVQRNGNFETEALTDLSRKLNNDLCRTSYLLQ